MIGKIFASIILISVLYIFGIFFAPNLSDSLAEKAGILSVNTKIRQLKDGLDGTSDTLLQIKDASGAIGNVRSIVNQTNEQILETTNMVNGIRQTAERKIEQGERVIDSVKKTKESLIELQNNVSAFTTLTGVTTTSGVITTSGITVVSEK